MSLALEGQVGGEADPSVAPHKRRGHLESIFLDIMNKIVSSSSRGKFLRVGSLAYALHKCGVHASQFFLSLAKPELKFQNFRTVLN